MWHNSKVHLDTRISFGAVCVSHNIFDKTCRALSDGILKRAWSCATSNSSSAFVTISLPSGSWQNLMRNQHIVLFRVQSQRNFLRYVFCCTTKVAFICINKRSQVGERSSATEFSFCFPRHLRRRIGQEGEGGKQYWMEFNRYRCTGRIPSNKSRYLHQIKSGSGSAFSRIHETWIYHKSCMALFQLTKPLTDVLIVIVRLQVVDTHQHLGTQGNIPVPLRWLESIR